MAQPEKDEKFEVFLNQELSKETDREAALNTRRAAHIAFYGVHYQQLFVEKSLSVAESGAATHMRRRMKPTMPAADMARGEDLYERFVSKVMCQLHPPFREEMFAKVASGVDRDIRLTAENILRADAQRWSETQEQKVARGPGLPVTSMGEMASNLRKLNSVIQAYYAALDAVHEAVRFHI